MTQTDLFPAAREPRLLAAGAMLLPGFARDDLLAALARVLASAPLRHMQVPGGGTMSVAMSNCGALGWITDRKAYRYERRDPLSGRPWPALPDEFATLAGNAARAAGYADFHPDACLINRYEPGARMGLHQDRNEIDFNAPIVSVSLGLPAVFLWGGLRRADKTQRIRLEHGDVVVWGGPSRLVFHGIAPLAEGSHPQTGRCRFNLTFRRAG